MIRRTIVEDLDIICKIGNQDGLTSGTKNGGYSYYDWYVELLEEEKSFFYTYLIDNKPVGFILGEELLTKGALIWCVGVLPEYNSRGIGVRLFKYFEQEIIKRGLNWIYTEGFVDTISIDMMKKLGFHTSGMKYRTYAKMIE